MPCCSSPIRPIPIRRASFSTSTAAGRWAMAATSEPAAIALEAGALSAGLVPEIGGSLAWFRIGDTDVMRPLTAERQRAGDVLGVAMFPMVPYANRIADNAFAFGGRTWR